MQTYKTSNAEATTPVANANGIDNESEGPTPLTSAGTSAKRPLPNAFAPPFKFARRSAALVAQKPVLCRAKSTAANRNLSDLKRVSRLHSAVTRDDPTLSHGEKQEKVRQVGEQVQKMGLASFVTGDLVRNSGVLVTLLNISMSSDASFSAHRYPWNVRSDAQELFNRWQKSNCDYHLLRGIAPTSGTTLKGNKRRFYKFEDNYPFLADHSQFGANDLENGQWFPLQICAKRDGAHDEVEAGIHGQTGKGADSIVLANSKDSDSINEANGKYANEDHGDEIDYCGTANVKNDKDTDKTKLLKLSFEHDRPIRVLRSARLPQTNKYRPSHGLRYDGLYRIIRFGCLDTATAMYRFHLVREHGQTPIRYKNEYVRPNAQEVRAWVRIQALLNGDE